MSAMQFYNSIGLEESLVDQIKLYPNPTQGRVNLELNQVELVSLSIIDATGQRVLSQTGCSGLCVLDLSEEGAGMYRVILITIDGRQVIKPVVLIK
jgi:hypothetical protein